MQALQPQGSVTDDITCLIFNREYFVYILIFITFPTPNNLIIVLQYFFGRKSFCQAFIVIYNIILSESRTLYFHLVTTFIWIKQLNAKSCLQ